MTLARIKILIADDHAVLRAGIRLLIDSQTDMQVIGAAGNSVEAVQQTLRLKPDVLLLDLSMPSGGGLSALRHVAKECPNVRVLVLTMHEDRAHLQAAVEAGASGYVTKRVADTELLAAIRAVHAGRMHIDTASVGDRGEAIPVKESSKKHGTARIPLSQRELEVLKSVAEGHTNREIAGRLALSVKTVEGYRARLHEKLGLQTRADLVRYALAIGLLE